MTMHRNRDGIDFECDNCGDGVETRAHDLADARLVLAQAEWRTRKVDEEWKHYCPGCSR